MAAKRSKIQTQPEYERIPVSPETPLVMAGLCEDNPRDFLAALGVLRLVDMLWSTHQPTLCWNEDGHPLLKACLALPEEWTELMTAALQSLNNQTPHPFVHHKVIKTELETLRCRFVGALEFGEASTDLAKLPAVLYAAYGSQVHDMEKGVANPTAFSFSNGQGGKELLRDIAEMIDEELTPANLVHDLTTCGSGKRDAKSFRWNPAELRTAAYRAHDPGSGVKGDVTLDYPSANILAFFGLTYYPVVDTTQREYTLGISRRRRLGDCFTWPIWEHYLSSDVISSILHHPFVHTDPPNRLGNRSLGISRAYRSVRMKVGKPPTISLYFATAEALF